MKTLMTLVIMSLSLSAVAAKKCNPAGNFAGLLKQEERAPIAKSDTKAHQKGSLKNGTR